jgi:hypothetical protein
MKRLLFFVSISSVITSCTLTTYTGEIINPPTVEFNKPNFRYIETISGSAAATYHGFWASSKSKVLDGQFNEAKQNMYKQHQFRPNQIITNMTEDVVRTTSYKGWGRYEINIVLSGDIYEFYNGDPSRFKNRNINDDEQETSYLEKEVKVKTESDTSYFLKKEVKVKTESDTSYFLKKGFSKYENNQVLSEGTEIIFKRATEYFGATVKSFKQNRDYCTVFKVIKINLKDNSFSATQKGSEFCPRKFIVAYK